MRKHEQDTKHSAKALSEDPGCSQNGKIGLWLVQKEVHAAMMGLRHPEVQQGAISPNAQEIH